MLDFSKKGRLPGWGRGTGVVSSRSRLEVVHLRA